jgi:hypothetical protein
MTTQIQIDHRGGPRYSEYLALRNRAGAFRADVHGMALLHNCPKEKWADSMPMFELEPVVDSSDHLATVTQDVVENAYTRSHWASS